MQPRKAERPPTSQNQLASNPGRPPLREECKFSFFRASEFHRLRMFTEDSLSPSERTEQYDLSGSEVFKPASQHRRNYAKVSLNEIARKQQALVVIQESEEETKRELLPPAPDSSAPLHTPAPPNPNEQSNLHAQMLGRLFYGKDVERKVICDWNDFGEPLSECSHAMRRHSVRRPFPTAKDESEKSEVSEALGGAPRTSKLRESMKMLQNPVPPTVTDPFSLSSKQR